SAPIPLRKAFEWFGHLIAKTVEEGAATQVYVASHPDLEGVSGAYFEDCNAVTVIGNHFIFDKPMAERLWAVGEDMAEDYLL
ncbi:oxidoreductase, partial [Gammaproteobacteria bacterium]|nr:oxidoreductase [Gammaproteobacteria bacterium]